MASPEGKSLSERYQNLSEEEYAFFQEVGDLARDMAERGETLWKMTPPDTCPDGAWGASRARGPWRHGGNVAGC